MKISTESNDDGLFALHVYSDPIIYHLSTFWWLWMICVHKLIEYANMEVVLDCAFLQQLSGKEEQVSLTNVTTISRNLWWSCFITFNVYSNLQKLSKTIILSGRPALNYITDSQWYDFLQRNTQQQHKWSSLYHLDILPFLFIHGFGVL